MRTQLGLVGSIAAGLAVGSLTMAGVASACHGPRSSASPSPNQTASQKQGIRGRIVSVNNGSITLAMHHHHAKGQAAAGADPSASQPMTKTFRIGARAQVAFVGGKSFQTATLADLKAGDEVAIEAPGGVAQKIAIMRGEHHTKPTT